MQNLINLIEGHPYLIRLAFYNLANRNITAEDFDNFFKTSATDMGIYRDHLQRLLIILRQKYELLEAYKKVINTDQPVKLDPILNEPLLSIGLVKMQGNNSVPYCNLYKLYFQNVL